MPIPVTTRLEAGTGNRIISRTRVEAIGFDIKDGSSRDVFGTAPGSKSTSFDRK